MALPALRLLVEPRGWDAIDRLAFRANEVQGIAHKECFLQVVGLPKTNRDNSPAYYASQRTDAMAKRENNVAWSCLYTISLRRRNANEQHSLVDYLYCNTRQRFGSFGDRLDINPPDKPCRAGLFIRRLRR